MAADVAPGLLRDYYGFLGWKGFDPQAWADLVEEAEERREQGLSRLPAIFGFDLDQKAIGTARAQRPQGRARRPHRLRAARAGLADRRSDRARRPHRSGRRPRPGGHQPTLRQAPRRGRRSWSRLYETLGERLKASFSGWEAAVFTGNPELGAHLGLRAHRVNVLYNGPLDCKLLLFHIGARRSRRRQRAAAADRRGAERSRRPASSRRTRSRSLSRGRPRRRHVREPARARTSSTCAAGPPARTSTATASTTPTCPSTRSPSTSTRTGPTCRSTRPRARSTRCAPGAGSRRSWPSCPRCSEIPPDHVVLKVRRPQRGADQYQKLRDEGRFLEVEEGGLRFLVNLTDYLDTGLFLDHRITRAAHPRARRRAGGSSTSSPTPAPPPSTRPPAAPPPPPPSTCRPPIWTGPAATWT